MGRAHGHNEATLVRRRSRDRLDTLQRRYPQIEWDIEPLAPATRAAVTEQFERLSGRYPLALESLSYIGVVNGDPEQPYGDNCWAQSFSNRVELNPYYFADPALLLRELAEAEADRWHPYGCTSIESVLTHEYAHVLYRRLAAENEFAIRNGVQAGGFGTVADTLQAWLAGHDPRHVSTYARASDEEAFAEAFSSLEHTPVRRQCLYVKNLRLLLDLLCDQQCWTPSRGRAA